jgi:pyruvate-ferredoxin/flavodoxin oxidoreductase
MTDRKMVTLDGNEAAAYTAHMTNEVIAIYPITPSSPMGEFSDAWSDAGTKNIWGTVPEVIELQSEAGAAGTVHGALQTGSLSTTFTASQGLLLMIPNMYKIAGELTPTVFHIAARTVASHALSIFGDHSDVMAARSTGFAMLASNSVQEAMDLALIAQAATLEGRLPIMHFFDGFRTSHEVAKVELIDRSVVREMIDDDLVAAHRQRALSPDRPVIRGTSQNPDVFFQSRETVNSFYAAMPDVVQRAMDKFAKLTGRQYHLYEYFGSAEAERVVILMGSGADAAEETVETLLARDEKVGVLKVRLYRPFDAQRLLDAIPATVTKIAVLDRTKEAGADGEPLYKDVLGAIAKNFASGGRFKDMPLIIGGRYGLASKEFTPGMIKAVFDQLNEAEPKREFTIGIIDDISNMSLTYDPDFAADATKELVQAVFYGLGSDGTVSANKNTIKIIGEETALYAQGYFQYDSKKAGAVTVSHVRFGKEPIRSTYLIGDGQASFIGCHQPRFVDSYDMLDKAAKGATFLINTHAGPDGVWDTLPRRMQEQILEKELKVYVIDAIKVARESGMGTRTNTVMQTCFFAISGVLPKDESVAAIKKAVEKTYGGKGQDLVDFNYRAIDMAVANLHEVDVPDQITSDKLKRPPLIVGAPEFVDNVCGAIISAKGDDLPVSAMPIDGTYPVGTAAYERRNLALEIPIWDEDLCIFCGKCAFVCPHAAIRSKVFPVEATKDAPASFKHIQVKGKEFGEGLHIAYQVAPEDCTGCNLCAIVCPARDKTNPEHKSLDMLPQEEHLAAEQANWDFFLTLPEFNRNELRTSTIKGSQVMQPLFEFSGACVGCGETPYVKLASQLFGDRMLVANATGCSSIYGGNLPTTPWTTNSEGRGPTWANSLFEDNAEFGFGFRISIDKQAEYARELVARLRDEIGSDLADEILNADQSEEAGIFEQRKRVDQLRERLAGNTSDDAKQMLLNSDMLCKKSVWIMGGDGWAHDIGFGGLDHVLASGRNVNILVLDTEVYSNTGGQASKATPTGAVAKFATGGKARMKKDLAQIAMTYKDVYVAQVAFGAKDVQTLKAFIEAESYDGVSIIIAYSPCIEHGIAMTDNMVQQELAVNSGHWPLLRYDPRLRKQGKNPLQLDSKKPKITYREFASTERRFKRLLTGGDAWLDQVQQEIDERFSFYDQMASAPAIGDGTDSSE